MGLFIAFLQMLTNAKLVQCRVAILTSYSQYVYQPPAMFFMQTQLKTNRAFNKTNRTRMGREGGQTSEVVLRESNESLASQT